MYVELPAALRLGPVAVRKVSQKPLSSALKHWDPEHHGRSQKFSIAIMRLGDISYTMIFPMIIYWFVSSPN